jgi:hypothetical protein
MRSSPLLALTALPLLVAVAAVRLSPATAQTPPPLTGSPSGAPAAPGSPAEVGVDVINIEWATQVDGDGRTTIGVVAVLQISDIAPPVGLDPEETEVVFYDGEDREVARGRFAVAVPRRLDPRIAAGLAGEVPLPAGSTAVRAEISRVGAVPLDQTYAPGAMDAGSPTIEGGALRFTSVLRAPAGADADALAEGYTLLRNSSGAPVALFILRPTPMGGTSRTVLLSAPPSGIDLTRELGVESSYAVEVP